VRSRGRKAPAKRQVEPSAARKTHAASTGLALELISGFGTKLMQEHKTARMAQEQQSLASGALLGQLQFSLSARPKKKAAKNSGFTKSSTTASG